MATNDPFAALEEAAARQAAQEKALQALAQARCRLVLGKDARSAFFATLALRLRPMIDWNIDTMATDGTKLFLNPHFVTALSGDELVGVVAHEVLHNALCHHTRRGPRDSQRWNVACDLAVNPLLLDAGFTLPPSRLLPGEGKHKHLPTGKSAEEYYGLLPDDQPAGSTEGQGSGTEDDAKGSTPRSDPGGCGGVQVPADGSPAACRQAEAEAAVAVAQAHQASQQRGPLPAGLARLVQEALTPKVDWREVLREFVSAQARNDYAWSPPNRRFIHQGLYLPGLRSEELGDIVLAIDTSGSIGARELSRFAAEAQGVLEAFDCTLTVLYHDAEVLKVQRWCSSDGPLVLEPMGGGGTSHVCVFDWLARQGEQATCVVCLTDLWTEFPSEAPAMPVLWAVVGSNDSQPPFGLRVAIETWRFVGSSTPLLRFISATTTRLERRLS
jgi:predicted metal-dependent peptidase